MRGLRFRILLRRLFCVFMLRKRGIFATHSNRVRQKVEMLMLMLQRRARKMQKTRSPSSAAEPIRSIRLCLSRRYSCWLRRATCFNTLEKGAMTGSRKRLCALAQLRPHSPVTLSRGNIMLCKYRKSLQLMVQLLQLLGVRFCQGLVCRLPNRVGL